MVRTEVRGGQILDGSVSLTADVTGTLPVGNGGTGQTTLAGAGILVSGGALGTPASGNASNLTSFPTLNQNTSGSAATLTTARTINGVSFNGSANIVITARNVTVNAPGATPSINTDVTDQATFTGLAAAITSMSTNLTGTPVTGQKLMIRFTDGGTARAITWGASFGSSGVATLLATTVISKVHHVGLVYDGSVWRCLAVDATGY